MIVSTPLLNVQFPGNALQVYSVMITVATFDILPTDLFYPTLFPLPEDDHAYNDKFNDLGFGSTYFVGNFGSALLGVLWVLICYMIYPIASCCTKSKCCVRYAKNLRGSLFWNGSILLIQEAYLDIMICCLINIREITIKVDTIGGALSIFLSVLLLICCISLPIFTIVYIRPRYNELREPHLKDRFESIYEMIDLNGNKSAVMWPVLFCLRRALFALAVVYTNNVVLQLMAFTFPTLAVVILVG